MMRCIVLLGLVTAVAVTVGECAEIFDFLQPQKFDGVSRVKGLALTEETLKKRIVFVTQELSNVEAELVAQTLEGRPDLSIDVCVAAPGVLQDTNEGDIIVLTSKDRRIRYHGLKQTSSIVKFISTLNEPGVKMINEAWEKIAFRKSCTPRLVGYFTVPSNEYDEFVLAENLFGTQISFHAISDPLIAEHFKFNATGQIAFYPSRRRVDCAKNPATIADIQRLIAFSRDRLVKISELNALDPEFSKRAAFVLVTDASPLSQLLLKVTKKTFFNETAIVTNERVFWLDTSDFPTVDLIAQKLPGLTSIPSFGRFEPTNNQFLWLDTSALHLNVTEKLLLQGSQAIMKMFIDSFATPSPGSTKTEL